MSDLRDLPLICLEFTDRDVCREASSLKEAWEIGAKIHKAKKDDLAARLQDRQKLNRLSREPLKETNDLFLKSLRDALQKNILNLRKLSKFNQNNHTTKIRFNKGKSAFLNNLEKAQSLGLLKVIPDQQKESDIKSPSLTSGEIKLHHSIDPSYLVTSRDRSKLHFMIVNNENSQPSSEAILRIFSDEGNHKNPFYHLNIEFTNILPQDRASINSLFRNNGTVSDTNDDFLEKFQHEDQKRASKLFQTESKILEYLFEDELGKAALPRDNLNLLISINELLSAQKSEERVRSGQIKSGETFDGMPFYRDKIVNTSQKPLDFHDGLIKTENLEIQFLIFDNKKRGTIPKLNLKLTDKIRGHSKLLLLDAEKLPELKNGFQEYLNSFLSFIQKKESKLIAPNPPQLKRPDRPKS